jgi:putative endonuclease
MADHNVLGKRGEKEALKMLISKGYEILEINWRHKRDELDIIAREGNELVIVEVKTRSTDYFGDPEESVGELKMQRLVRAADEYIEQNEIELECRYDIVSIIIKDNNINIRHIKDAFFPFQI